MIRFLKVDTTICQEISVYDIKKFLIVPLGILLFQNHIGLVSIVRGILEENNAKSGTFAEVTLCQEISAFMTLKFSNWPHH